MSSDPAPESLISAWASRVGEAPACQRLSERSYVFRVRAPGQNFIFKEAGLINPQGNVPRKLAADTALLRHLKAQGVGVAVSELTDDGLPYLQRDGRYYTLTAEVPSAPDENAPLDRVFRNTGAAIARLHRAMASYPGPLYSWTMDLPRRILDEAAPAIMRCLGPEDNETFTAALDAIRQPIARLLAGLPSQIIHYDCHGGNIMRVGDAVSGFIDLDHIPIGPRLWDLCYLLVNEAIYQDPTRVEAWFEIIIPNLFSGYAQEIEISDAEKDASPYMMMGILLIFAAWFFEPLNRPDLAKRDMRVFYWIFENLRRIRASVSLLPAPPDRSA
jgi:Ser/Thr protein kinase RdoA (MazF antagonist)